MQSRWLNVVVVALWLAMMGWLVNEKVLPSFGTDNPLNYRSILETQKNLPPVGWHVCLNDHSLGWALTETQSSPNGLSEIHGRVHFDNFPLEEIMPSWFRNFSQWWTALPCPTGNMQIDARSVFCIDPSGHLIRFETAAKIDPLKDDIRIRGSVKGRRLDLSIKAQNVSLSTDAFLPSDAVLSDGLSPQMHLPNLRAGQKWSTPICNPLWPSKEPLETVIATVQGRETIRWNGLSIDAWVVVTQNAANNAGLSNAAMRSKLWVHPDGAVLKQEIHLFESTIVFERMPQEAADKLANFVGEHWWAAENPHPGENHD